MRVFRPIDGWWKTDMILAGTKTLAELREVAVRAIATGFEDEFYSTFSPERVIELIDRFTSDSA